jgi:hypothetical protein
VPDWRSGLSEDLKANPSLGKFKDVGSLAKSYVEVESLVGKKGIIPPGDNDPPETWDQFWNSLGRPENVTGYDMSSFEAPEALKEVWDQDLQDGVVAEMHKLGLTNAQVRGVVNTYAELQSKNMEGIVGSVDEQREAGKATLRQEWGVAYPAKADYALRAFKAAAAAIGEDPEALAGSFLSDGGLLGDNVMLTKMFAMIGESSGEHSFLGDKGGRTTPTPEEAEAEIASLDAHPALYDKRHPEHNAIVAKRDALYRARFPDPVQDDRG